MGDQPPAPHPSQIIDPYPGAMSVRPLWRQLAMAYRLRWKRRRLLFRIWRKRGQIAVVQDHTAQIAGPDILLFACLRNEAQRLPHFLNHYRALGVSHFLIVDNSSTDGTRALLEEQPDVSLWQTSDSYRLSRFGMDWLGMLQWQYGHDHWCLTVDADETLIFPRWPDLGLRGLTERLDRAGLRSFGALLLDMYPKGPLEDGQYQAGDDPFARLNWFDSGNYRAQLHPVFANLWIQGGVRDRKFFGPRPERAPTLNKVPLVKWDRSFAYVTSTHHMLPPTLNRVFDDGSGQRMTGVLLHSKFLPDIGARSAEEQQRKEHFENSDLYHDYYNALIRGETLWSAQSHRYGGWEDLVRLGLMIDSDVADKLA